MSHIPSTTVVLVLSLEILCRYSCYTSMFLCTVLYLVSSLTDLIMINAGVVYCQVAQ